MTYNTTRLLTDLDGGIIPNQQYSAGTDAYVLIDENAPLPVAGNLLSSSATFARPADTTAYTAIDVVSNSTSAPTVMTFSNVVSATGGSGEIIKARLYTDNKATTARFRLHLYTSAPTAINDNSPFTLLWADRASKIGRIDFDAMAER